MSDYTELMRHAIGVCERGIATGQTPFAAVIATPGGDVVAEAHNTVWASGDPTAHAEIGAIRAACEKLGTISLAGHVIVSTCEPCPMCAAAIHWARLDVLVYGATIADARSFHFNELALSCEALYQRADSPVRVHPLVLRDESRSLFELWRRGPNPNPY